MILEEVTNECCLGLKWVCNKETCPEPPECEQWHEVKVKRMPESVCCPSYECERPKKCIVKIIHTDSPDGGETVKNENDWRSTLKDVGDVWHDGPCRECNCTEGFETKCSIKSCARLEDSPDNRDYVLTYEPIPYECCSDIKRAACKYNGKVYNVSEEWFVDGDYCTKYRCSNIDGVLQKTPRQIKCNTECNQGFEYVPPSAESKTCCGTCKQVQCVWQNETKDIDTQWESDDFCTHYECVSQNDTVSEIRKINNKILS